MKTTKEILRVHPSPHAMMGHQIIVGDNIILGNTHDLDLACRVVKSVNEYDTLKADNERLTAQAAQLREALQACLCYMEADADDDQERMDHSKAVNALNQIERAKPAINVTVEVESGCVSGVYADGQPEDWPIVRVVDLDPSKQGGSVVAELQTVQSIEVASDIVIEAVDGGKGDK